MVKEENKVVKPLYLRGSPMNKNELAAAGGKQGLESCHGFSFGFGFFAFRTGEDFAYSAASEKQVTVRQQLKVGDREETPAQELKGSWDTDTDRAVCFGRGGQLLPCRDAMRNGWNDAVQVQGWLRFGGGKLRGF